MRVTIEEKPPGTIVWTDLTVGDAEGIRDFYRPRGVGSLRFCVLRDPAGAVLALIGLR